MILNGVLAVTLCYFTEFGKPVAKFMHESIVLCLKNVVSHFCNNFINCWPILKILSLLDTEKNCLQNKYNNSRHLWKTSLHYFVKHKTLKSAFALSIIDDKAVNSANKIF